MQNTCQDFWIDIKPLVYLMLVWGAFVSSRNMWSVSNLLRAKQMSQSCVKSVKPPILVSTALTAPDVVFFAGWYLNVYLKCAACNWSVVEHVYYWCFFSVHRPKINPSMFQNAPQPFCFLISSPIWKKGVPHLAGLYIVFTIYCICVVPGK